MKRPEEALQKQVVGFLRAACPTLLWFAVPNQRGTRSEVENRILKGLGVRHGVVDLCLIIDGGRACFIELKAPKGKQNDNQEIFEQDCLRVGAPYLVCRTLAEVEGALAAWGVKSRARAA